MLPNTEELKPCPFCGEKPRLLSAMDRTGQFTWEIVKCITKECGVYLSNADQECNKRPLDEVVKQWNTRVC